MPKWQLAGVSLALLVAAGGGSTGGTETNQRPEPATPSERHAGLGVDLLGPPSSSEPREQPKLPPILAVDDGVRRFELDPTWEGGQLCAFDKISAGADVGWTGGIEQGNCQLSVETVRPWVTYGGHSDLAVDWAGVIGLAENKVKRVVLVLADGSDQELELKEWPRTPWLAFKHNFEGPPLPASIVAFGEDDQALAKVDLRSRIQPSCFVDEICAHGSESPRSTWITDVDASEPQGLQLTRGQARATYEFLKRDQLLQEILRSREHWVEEVGLWYTCDYKGQLGTWARLRLAKAGVFERDWPSVKIARDGDSYVEKSRRARVAKVDGFFLLIDLKRRRLVAITPEIDYEAVFRDDAIYNSTEWGPGDSGETCAPWLE
jgi:hypothetical protein